MESYGQEKWVGLADEGRDVIHLDRRGVNVSDGTLSNTLRMTDAHITLWVLWLLTVKSDVLQALHGQLDAHSITSESS